VRRPYTRPAAGRPPANGSHGPHSVSWRMEPTRSEQGAEEVREENTAQAQEQLAHKGAAVHAAMQEAINSAQPSAPRVASFQAKENPRRVMVLPWGETGGGIRRLPSILCRRRSPNQQNAAQKRPAPACDAFTGRVSVLVNPLATATGIGEAPQTNPTNHRCVD
jgi:hypothetical protein